MNPAQQQRNIAFTSVIGNVQDNAVDSSKQPPAYTMYANTNGTDTSGSVMYYVLEYARRENI